MCVCSVTVAVAYRSCRIAGMRWDGCRERLGIFDKWHRPYWYGQGLFQGQVRNGFLRTQHTYGLESPSPRTRSSGQTKIWALFFLSVFHPPTLLSLIRLLYLFSFRQCQVLLRDNAPAASPVNGRRPKVARTRKKKTRKLSKYRMTSPLCAVRFSFDSNTYAVPSSHRRRPLKTVIP